METIQHLHNPNNNIWCRSMDTNKNRRKNPTKNTGQSIEKNPQNPNNNPIRDTDSRDQNMGPRNPNNEKTNPILQNNNDHKQQRHHNL